MSKIINKMAIKKFVIIVAGGSGSRMQTNVPKQFLPLGDKIVLMQTIKAFFDAIQNIEIIVVLPKNQIEFWHELCEKYTFSVRHQIIEGGNSRFQSVKNGLLGIETNHGLVAIHDGVRPLVNKKTIIESFEWAQKHGSAIATVKPKDSMRKIVSDAETKSVDRTNYLIVQTPQTFDLEKLKQAYLSQELPHFTDDASVFEYANNQIFTFEGTYQNLKITTPEDLKLAEILFAI